MQTSNQLLAKFTRSAASVSLLALTAMLASCGSESDLPIRGETQLNELFVADFDLIDMNGEPATDERFEGKPMLLYFGFTHCPDVCPAALSVLSSTLDELGSDVDDVHTLFITVDPERDTPERLKEYLTFNENILGLTGSTEAIGKAVSNIRGIAQRVEIEGSEVGYVVDHVSKFYLTNADGEPQVMLDDGLDPEVLAERIRRWL